MKTYAPSLLALAVALVYAPHANADQAAAATRPTATLDTVVVTATRANESAGSIPQTVRVIRRQEVEAQLASSNDAARLLQRHVPGLQGTTQTMSSTSMTMRGRELQILVDGVPRSTPLRQVSRILSLIDLNNVERVEVVNGASGVWGSGATGGVVNFITRKAAPGIFKVDVNLGMTAFTENVGDSLSPDVSVRASGNTGQFDYVASLAYQGTRDVFDAHGTQLPSDAIAGQGGSDNLERYVAGLKLGRNLDADRRLELSLDAVRLDQKPDYFTDYSRQPVAVDYRSPYTGQSVYENSAFATLRYTDAGFFLGRLDARASYKNIEKRFAYSPLLSVNPSVYYSGNPASPVSPNSQTVVNSEQAEFAVTVNTPLGQAPRAPSLTWGLEGGQDRTAQTYYDGVNTSAPMKQTTWALFAQLDLPVTERLKLRGGARYENIDLDIGAFTRSTLYSGKNGSGANLYLPAVDVKGGSYSYDATVFNLGAVYDLTDNLNLYGGFSQGYSLPDVGGFTRRAGNDKRYLTTNPNAQLPAISYANLGVEAVVVDNYELGLRGVWDRWQFNTSAYLSRSDKGTNYDVVTNRLSQQKEEIRGLDLTASYAVQEYWTLGGNLGYTEGKRDYNGDGVLEAYLPNNRIPSPLRTTLYSDYRFGNGARWYLEGVYLQGRHRWDGTVNKTGQQVVYDIDSSFLVNTSLAYPLDKTTTLDVGVDNLFNRQYLNSTASAVRNSQVSGFGRTVRVGVRASF
ncbi:TonB-dependent receptor [Gulbenkiania mobilis]|uniref:Iron complex outermembrane receptor protein n=1 Tax=Gulbenkiania mobilis TaxID=397457 RepID=A0ABY2CZ42_GULMO|nr:iron complex outermembrane receptor protein [Gulbenkiania mobilis]